MATQQFYVDSKSCYGGSLRNHRSKRVARRLSNKRFHHLVFKMNRRVHNASLRSTKTFSLCTHVIKVYAKRFRIRIASHSIQKDHIHLLVRTNRKSNYQSFFRVVAGQIAQRVTDTYHLMKFNESFWKYRPFTRIVRTRKAYYITKAYIRLNELEGRQIIPYQKSRLKKSTPKLWYFLKINPKNAGWEFYNSIVDTITFKKRGDRYPKYLSYGGGF